MIYKFQNKALSNKVEILSNEVLIGTIQFNNWKSDVIAEINGKQYLIKKKSIWKNGLEVYGIDSQKHIANIDRNMWKGSEIIELKLGGKYNFTSNGFWKKNWTIFAENNETIQFIKSKSFWNQEGEIQSEIRDKSKADFLVLLGVFLIFLKMKESAAAAS